MSEIIKVDQQYLDDMLTLRDQMFVLLGEIGQLYTHITLLKEEISSSEVIIDQKMEKYKEFLAKENEIVLDINSKYGRGFLDIESGIFTPEE
jgi:hypothetical protein